MLKPVAAFVASIIILLAASYFVESAFSPLFENCIATHKQSDEKITTERDVTASVAGIERNIRCSGEFIDAHNGAITALATIVIAAFTVTLWIATSTQARLTREAFIADKRAFVFASGIQPLYGPDLVTGHFNWRVGPVWQNSGDTATQGLRLYTDGLLSNVPIPQTFDFNQVDPIAPPGPGMLGPKMSSAGGQAPHMPAPGLTPQDLLDIQNGRKFFYLWGWARYRDGLLHARTYNSILLAHNVYR